MHRLADVAGGLTEPLHFVDVGARWGGDERYVSIGPQLRLTGFEPDPQECERLNAAARDTPWVRYVPTALAERAGDYTLHVTAEPACSSLYRPDPLLVGRHPELRVMREVAEQRVPATTLDRWSRAEGVGRVDFLKLDTQGSELDILRGADELLASVWGLEIEVEFNPLYQGQPLFADVDAFLRARGFVLWRLTNLAHYGSGEGHFTRWDVQHFDSRPIGFAAEGGQLYWGHAHYVRAGAALGDYPSPREAARAWCVWTITGWEDLADAAAERAGLATTPASPTDQGATHASGTTLTTLVASPGASAVVALCEGAAVDDNQRTVLVTGGSGFFGEILLRALLERGIRCVNIDLERDSLTHPNLTSVQGDIRDRDTLEALFEAHDFSAVFHLAAILAHAVSDESFLWSSNVEGTRNVADLAKVHGVPKIVFTSSNCLWGENLGRPVREEDPPRPVEVYGRSKLEAERILSSYADDLSVVVFRCPTIIEAGRLGLLAILFEFIDEGRKVWVVGRKPNVYQFIYAPDLVQACLKALDYEGSDVFNIGSDDVKSFKEVYEYVIRKAGTKARVASLPRTVTLGLMKLAYALKLSPLGPYQYKMIAESFVFDTSKIKRKLGWRPTLTNEEMLYRAYQYYHDHRKEISGRTDVSAHKQGAKMGVIRLLKWLS